MLSVPNCFVRPRDNEIKADYAKGKFSHADGDHLTLLNVYHAWEGVENKGRGDWCNSNFINSRVMSNAENVRN